MSLGTGAEAAPESLARPAGRRRMRVATCVVILLAAHAVLAVHTDVSQLREIEALAHQAVEAFGTVDLLFNNAGVARIGSIWECTHSDWEWIMGINLWGVIHGVRVFVPIMLAQGTECYIVNTASMSGLISAPGAGAYNVTKHGVVTLSETLHYELTEREPGSFRFPKLEVSI